LLDHQKSMYALHLYDLWPSHWCIKCLTVSLSPSEQYLEDEQVFKIKQTKNFKILFIHLTHVWIFLVK